MTSRFVRECCVTSMKLKSVTPALNREQQTEQLVVTAWWVQHIDIVNICYMYAYKCSAKVLPVLSFQFFVSLSIHFGAALNYDCLVTAVYCIHAFNFNLLIKLVMSPDLLLYGLWNYSFTSYINNQTTELLTKPRSRSFLYFSRNLKYEQFK